MKIFNAAYSAALTFALLALGMAFAVSPLAAQDAPAPAPAPAPGAEAKEAPVPPEVDRVLRQSEKAGEAVQKLQCTFEYHYFKRLIRAEEWYSGTLLYQQPSNFLIGFIDGEKQTFRFNGRIFVEDRPAQMQRNVYRLRKEEEPPVDSISIERTPFPLPFGQKRDEVLKHFTVEYRGAEVLPVWKRPEKPDAPDEKKYEHLVLTPKKDSPMSRDYVRLDFWFDMDTGLPRQIRTQDESKAVLTVRFANLQLNDKVKADKADFEEPKLPGGEWKRVYEDLTEKPATPPAAEK